MVGDFVLLLLFDLFDVVIKWICLGGLLNYMSNKNTKKID